MLANTGTIYMIADFTKYNTDIQEAMAGLGRGALSLYGVYPADGGEPVILPQLLSPDIVIAALNQASRKKA